MITFLDIKNKLRVFYLLIPLITCVFLSLMFNGAMLLGSGYLWFHLVIFVPSLFTLKDSWTERAVIGINMVIGYTVGATIVDYYILKGNLWPFTVGIAPFYALPPLLIYAVVISLLNRIILRNERTGR